MITASRKCACAEILRRKETTALRQWLFAAATGLKAALRSASLGSNAKAGVRAGLHLLVLRRNDPVRGCAG